MKFSGILAIATTLVSLASAAPATKFKDVTTPFYLVTTTQSTSNSHSSKLKNAGPHGIGSYVYNSTSVQAGGELQFLAQSEPNSGFALKSGYLLTINGTEKGWTLCTGDLGQTVVYYKGTDASCTPTYIQAVSTPPY
ncbi:hypothetical protein H2203_007277 [Taxawa tesnikishii (nom. ined.)]|nr:hypothetical protein H2203_007277 [Dothideales sp. JES 119]